MIYPRLNQSLWMVLISATSLIPAACSRTNVAASSDAGKIPITTKSEEARKEFLQGRDLFDRLQVNDSVAHFDKAIVLDPEFATAELYRSNSSPTTKELFEHIQKAVSLADKASSGEKELILATQAGVSGDPAKQKVYLEKVVAEYPNDERAQNNLGAWYFGIQDMDKAVEHLKKAAEISPEYLPTYNLLGYAYRQQGDYANAEQTFKKYIELIPNDPNPYDSYAELLLKMGRYDESIAQYRKALTADPTFNASHFGVAADLMYLGRSKDATNELQTMATKARNDGELRTAYFGMAVVSADSAKFDEALAAMGKEYAVAEKSNDVVSMSADLQAEGIIYLAKQDYAGAAKVYDKSYRLIADSSQPQEIKDNAALLYEFNQAEVAVNRKDLAGAKAHAEEFRKGAEASNNPQQIKQAHEIAGRIAMLVKDNDTAISELKQSNLQDPQNLYRLGQIYQAKGDTTTARDYYGKAASFNSLPFLRYAFIRTKAQKLAAA